MDVDNKPFQSKTATQDPGYAPAPPVPTSSPTAAAPGTVTVPNPAQDAADWLAKNPGKNIYDMPGGDKLPITVLDRAIEIYEGNKAKEALQQDYNARSAAIANIGGANTLLAPDFSPPKTFNPISPASHYGPPGLAGIASPLPGMASRGAGGAPTGASSPATGASPTSSVGEGTGLGAAKTTPQPTVSDFSKQLAGALDYMQDKPKDLGSFLIQLGANIADAIGASKKAWGGVESPTRLQREYQMRLASQQQANQIGASAVAKFANIQPEAQGEILKAIAAGDIATAQAIAISNGILPNELAKIREQYQVYLREQQAPGAALGGQGSAQAAGRAITGGIGTVGK